MKKAQWTRREVCVAAGGVGALAALGIVAQSQTQAGTLLRPPGSVNEAQFAARCIKCDRCRSVCHTDVIVPADWADGLKRMRTPKLDFRLGYCDLCARCAQVCPTGAIVPFDPQRVRLGLAHVTERCIALRTGACRICKDKCPEEAITLTEAGAPVVDALRCNGCGLCEKLCPANVYQSYRSGSERGIVVRAIVSENAP